MTNSYSEFIDSKRFAAHPLGFDARNLLDPIEWLRGFQKECTARSIHMGRAGLWASTGLGKSRMEMARAMILADHTQKPSLILTPLAVVGQFIEEAKKCKGVDICKLGGSAQIQVTNYGKLHLIDPSIYGSVDFDEGSIFKGDGKIKRSCEEMFADTIFRCSDSATPFPNDVTEIGRQAEVLGIMSMQSMLARWFVHDSADTSVWRLKGHAKDSFWQWVKTWAVVARLPSDLGFDDDGYILPPLVVDRIVVESDQDDALFPNAQMSATGIHASMRKTAKSRAEAVAALVLAEPDEPWMVLCATDYEAEELRAVVPGVVEVSGGMPDEKKEGLLLGFPRGDYKWLLSKDSIVSYGLNFQHCRRIAFVGASYSMERVYQALRRCWRYGQKSEVRAWVVSAETEWSVLESWQRKVQEYDASMDEMVQCMTVKNFDYSLHVSSTGDDAAGDGWKALRGDCVERIKDIETGSVGYCIFSPPFASLYTYSDLQEDMGNCTSDGEFMDHFGFLVPEIKRVMMPGRLVSIHCMDLPSTKERDGVIGLKDFPGLIVKLFEANGFIFHSRVTIWKDPLLAAVRTKALGLLHKQVIKDSAKSRQGCADYLLTFKVHGDNPEPVAHGEGFTRYLGDNAPSELAYDPSIQPGPKPPHVPRFNVKYSHEVWQRYASPVWMDINQTDVLPFTGARAEKDERHICPLQLGVIRRGIELWSNPGDLVFSPFGGVGSEGYVALQEGRRAVLIELKDTYFKQLVANVTRAESCVQPPLFGDDDDESDAA